MLDMCQVLVARSLPVSKESWRHDQPLATPWVCGSRKVCDVSDFVVYTWAMDRALTACQCGLAQTARLRMCIWFHCWGLEFWLPRLMYGRKCLHDQLSINTLAPETCMSFPGQRPSTRDPVVLCQKKARLSGLREGARPRSLCWATLHCVDTVFSHHFCCVSCCHKS